MGWAGRAWAVWREKAACQPACLSLISLYSVSIILFHHFGTQTGMAGFLAAAGMSETDRMDMDAGVSFSLVDSDQQTPGRTSRSLTGLPTLTAHPHHHLLLPTGTFYTQTPLAPKLPLPTHYHLPPPPFYPHPTTTCTRPSHGLPDTVSACPPTLPVSPLPNLFGAPNSLYLLPCPTLLLLPALSPAAPTNTRLSCVHQFSHYATHTTPPPQTHTHTNSLYS